MVIQHPLKRILISTASAFLLLNSSQAFAWERDRSNRHDSFQEHYRQPHRYPKNEISLALSDGFFSIFVSNKRFYFSNGVYYRRDLRGYVAVEPPFGAVVREIPPYYNVVVINRTTYYTYDGIYYQYTPQGYMVVQQPTPMVLTTVLPPAPMPAPMPVTAASIAPDNAYTVNIPETNGSYTSVLIKRSATGFTGPQGEFYPEFPKIDQLKVMYGAATRAKP